MKLKWWTKARTDAVALHRTTRGTAELAERISEEPAADLILMVKYWTVPLKVGKRQRCQHLLQLFALVLEVLASTVRRGQELKGTQVGKEEANVFAVDLTSDTEKSKLSKEARLQNSRSMYKNQLHFYTLAMTNLN